MHSFTFYIHFLVLLPSLALALPHGLSRTRLSRRDAGETRNFTVPIYSRKRGGAGAAHERRGTYSGSVGLGDTADLFYTVPITIGDTDTAVNLDTGSSDLWVVSDACKTNVCKTSRMPAYPSSQIKPAGGSVALQYGDSLTGTHAKGPVAQDTASIAGLSMPQQPFAAISDTNNTSVMNGANGIFGLGFPSSSQVQATVINSKFNSPTKTDDFVLGTTQDGPLLSRLAASGALEQPMFTIALQRDTIDIGGQSGSLTVGKLPDGVDNSSLTWVPVRLYTPKLGGLNPPSFAPNEVYPLRWEVLLDAVYLDGQKLADSTVAPQGISNPGLSALIDTGNSILRGPSDVVSSILRSVSPAFAANRNAAPTFPCGTPHNLTFQIGGKMFPVDPRDFVSQNQTNDATTCIANNIVNTDPPSAGALFSWSLGDPFMKSTLVAFYYGNLTHPSVDPPRIGFLSTVPTDAVAELDQAIDDAKENNGNFETTSQIAPTGSASEISVAPSTLAVPTAVSSSASAAPSAPSSTSSSDRSKNGAQPSAHLSTVAVLSTALLSSLIWTLF
ncbi:acid protease [Dentipellis sp. KUC8613]|nr:acid protease [Dentipellis sp. KUC8613]